MFVLQVEHNVDSYEGWKKAFESDPINRKKSGVKSYQVYQLADDPKYVVIDLYFETLEESKSTLAVLQNLWAKVHGTVMVNPKSRILEVKETIEIQSRDVMLPRIETLREKKLVGQQMVMSHSQNKTSELWRSFMSRRLEITNAVGNDLYSMQIYDDQHFANFNPQQEFTKMATIEVVDFGVIPDGMDKFILPGGLYAVFLHLGGPNNGAATFKYIFATWLPSSGYTLDDRPHFEVLGEKYKNDDPNSEEEIWIPIKQKLET